MLYKLYASIKEQKMTMSWSTLSCPDTEDHHSPFQLFFFPRRADNQLPINVPSFSAVCRGPRMNVFEPFSFPFIREVVSKCSGANQMVLVPRLTVDRQRGLMLVRNDLQHRLLKLVGKVIDPAARYEIDLSVFASVSTE